jgi:hypothetical protein
VADPTDQPDPGTGGHPSAARLRGVLRRPPPPWLTEIRPTSASRPAVGLTRRDFLVGSGVSLAGVIGVSASIVKSRQAVLNVRSDNQAVFNVRDRNAVGDGRHDDTVAVQATVDAAQGAGGGVIYFPAGVYRLQPQTARRSDPGRNIAEGHAISVSGSHLTFRGDCADATRLEFYAYGGEANEASWQVVGGKVFRGGGFFLDGGSSPSTAQTDIAFENLAMNGTAHCTHNNSFPADTSTGDGWDLTHKGIWMRNDRNFDRIRISRCHVHGWKGEVIYYGGSGLGQYTVEDCMLFDTNGDCHSVSASWLTAVQNTAHTAATAGFEDVLPPGSRESTYSDNTIYDCDKEAMSLGSAGSDGPWGPVTIARNIVRDCPRTGFLVSTSHTQIIENRLTDCASTPGTQAIYCRTADGKPLHHVTIAKNRMEAVSRAVETGLAVGDAAAAGLSDITISGNWAGVTPEGVQNGATFNQGYDFGPSDQSGWTIDNNITAQTTYP